jgi:hypothetical protein
MPEVSPIKSQDQSLTSSDGTDRASLAEQDKNLDQLLKEIEAPKDPAPVDPGPTPPPEQPGIQLDPELYREIGIYGSHIIAGGIRIAVKPLKKDFLPLKPEQVEKVQPSTSRLFKKILDWAWPQLMEKHGEEAVAAMAWTGIFIDNLKTVEEPKKKDAAAPAREPLRGLVQPEAVQVVPVAVPTVSTVEVNQ